MMSGPDLGTWGGKPIAAWTQNFAFIYNDGDDDTLTAAQYVAATAEDDLDWLESVFQCNFESIEYSTVVWVGRGGGAASNDGWDSSESAGIYINCEYNPAGNTQATAETVRMLFVAELAELLMDFTPYGWDRASAYGEALSVVCATLRHPNGYYRSGAGPRIRPWLDSSPRPDWVMQGGGDDKNQTLYGAGILFLYYLLSQRRFALSRIVAAGGWNAPDTFNKLTGAPTGQAAVEFNALVALVPAGTRVTRDNLFPMLPAAQRAVRLDITDKQTSDVRLPDEIRVKLTAGLLCKPAIYTYHEHDLITEIDATARAIGFGSAQFRWKVNDVPLDVHNQTTATAIQIPVRFSDDTPDPTKVAFNQTVPVQYFINDSWNASALRLRNDTTPGNGQVTISVMGREGAVAGDPETPAESGYPFVTRDYEMSQQWEHDVERCSPRPILLLASEVAEMAHEVFILKHTPDPGPEGARRLAAAAERLEAQLRELTGANQGLRNAVLRAGLAAAAKTAGNEAQDLEFATAARGLGPSKPAFAKDPQRSYLILQEASLRETPSDNLEMLDEERLRMRFGRRSASSQDRDPTKTRRVTKRD